MQHDLELAYIGNVSLQQGNAEAMPFVAGSFDLIYCRSSLHHFTDPTMVVAEMARVCRPGGRVVLSDLVAPSAEVRDLFDDVHRLIDPSHVRVLLESELASVFPVGLTVSSGPIRSSRLPLSAILTEQSAGEQVSDALQRELRGGPATGFEPRDEDGQLTLAFTVCAVEVTIPTL